MRKLVGLALLGVVLLFIWGLAQLFRARFESGDVYPIGSSLRADALGLRALHDALSELLPGEVTRHRGREGSLASSSDATLLVAYLSISELCQTNSRFFDELNRAARSGARVVMALDDRQALRPRKLVCSGSPDLDADAKTRKPPGKSATSSKLLKDTPSCSGAAVGLWEFSVGWGDPAGKGSTARGQGASSLLPATIPWHTRAAFVDLGDAWRVVYARADHAVVIERELGQGSLVLLAESYLLTNEAQRVARAPELVAWLVGSHRRIVFDEAHLGVVERRTVMSVLRQLRLLGLVAGAALLALLYAWQKRRPLGFGSAGRQPEPRRVLPEGSSLARLLSRTVPPQEVLSACIAEARALNLSVSVEAAQPAKNVVQAFNRTFCPQEERPDAQ